MKHLIDISELSVLEIDKLIDTASDIIDNPESDIELLTVLMSPIFSFTPDELALFRANKRDGNIFSTIIFASNNGDEKKYSAVTPNPRQTSKTVDYAHFHCMSSPCFSPKYLWMSMYPDS